MTTETPIPSDNTTSITLIGSLGGIALISGVLVVFVYQLTMPVINENKRIAIEKALFRVLPGAKTRHDYMLSDQGALPLQQQLTVKGTLVYAAFDQQGEFFGIATEAAAPGYQDVIRVLYGYQLSCRCITGIKVLKMAETPGLGDKIAKDTVFQENFKALDARLNEQGTGLLNPIVTVKHGKKTQAWQIDAISGATISSKAVGRMLNESAQIIVPIIHKYAHSFIKQEPENARTESTR